MQNKSEKVKQENNSFLLKDNKKDDNKFQQYVFLTSSLLDDLIDDSLQQSIECSQFSIQTQFDSYLHKNIPLSTYINSIHKQTNFQPQCLIIALIYIDRYNLKQQQFNLNWLNVHKLLLACLLLATKFHDEIYYDNRAFQIGGGVNNVKLVQLEMKVFQSLEWNLFVQHQYYTEFLNSIFNAYLNQDQQSLNQDQQLSENNQNLTNQHQLQDDQYQSSQQQQQNCKELNNKHLQQYS